MNITDLLAIVVQHKASDLHLSAGMPPMMRVHGDICDMKLPCLDYAAIDKLITSTMNESQRQEYSQRLECDYAFEVPQLARFRVNAYHQQRGSGAVFRTIPTQILSLSELQVPGLFAELSMSPRGLILVTGPTGSGKSTTLAAMLDHRNSLDPGHILTIEDPIEFIHSSKRSLVNQREISTHTQSFENALRSALREDPDVILVGELRDLETIRLALTAAETGHLVLATLHTSSAAKTIDRLIDVFPAAEKDIVRAMLSESLIGVITQTLCKTINGQGRLAAHEIMLGTAAIRNLIRENKVAQMYSTIQTNQAIGMQTLDQCLEKLVKSGKISTTEARSKARFPEKFI